MNIRQANAHAVGGRHHLQHVHEDRKLRQQRVLERRHRRRFVDDEQHVHPTVRQTAKFILGAGPRAPASAGTAETAHAGADPAEPVSQRPPVTATQRGAGEHSQDQARRPHRA
jgi:hypothetical protein